MILPSHHHSYFSSPPFIMLRFSLKKISRRWFTLTAATFLSTPSLYLLLLPLALQVAAAGGIDAWNVRSGKHAALHTMLKVLVTASNIDEALTQVNAMIELGNEHYIWAYMYMRNLANHDLDLAYRCVASSVSC